MVQFSVDQLLDKLTLSDLISSAEKPNHLLNAILEKNVRNVLLEKAQV
jgi:hypothetical protein